MKVSPSFVLPLALVALLLSGTVLPAQDQTRSVQEELRRRSLYFGNVDGRDTAELREATKRYQSRKGFSASGKADGETLRSLGLVARLPTDAAPKELDWPAEPVLQSDERIDTVAVAKSLSEETGIAPASVVSKKVAQRQSVSTKRAKLNSSAAPVANGSQNRANNSPFIAPAELSRFANDYLAAMSSNDIMRQLKFYADKVEYYRNGQVDRRIVEQTLRSYHARWPSRSYTMGNEVHYSRITPQGEIVMTFPVSFTLKDGKRTVRGSTDNRLAISAATLDPRIASISEQRIRR
jgi:peptidoglycan hydrolase-like protein with peptidoglycan-binding domain